MNERKKVGCECEHVCDKLGGMGTGADDYCRSLRVFHKLKLDRHYLHVPVMTC